MPVRVKKTRQNKRFGSDSIRTDKALAAAADALDLLVESRVFLAERIVRIAQVLFVGHVADARLAMTNRRFNRRLVRIFRDARRSALRERGGISDQNQQRYRQDRFSHLGSPFRNYSIYYRVRS